MMNANYPDVASASPSVSDSPSSPTPGVAIPGPGIPVPGTEPNPEVPKEEKKPTTADETVPLAEAFNDFYLGLGGSSADGTSAPEIRTVVLQPKVTSNSALWILLAIAAAIIVWYIYKNRKGKHGTSQSTT